MTTFPIVALADGDTSDPAWFTDITDAVNGHETRLAVVESFNARIIRKTADQTVSSATTGTTLVNDTHLVAAVEVSTTYAFEVNAFYSSGITPDIKVAFTWPTGATGSWMAVGFLVTGINFEVNLISTAYQPASGTSQPFSGSTGNYPTLQLKGMLRVGSTAGNLQFQFAQNTSDAGSTTVKADSWMKIEKVLG